MKNSVVAIGIFDGVHRGHIKIIKKAVSAAMRMKAKSVVITFDPHPLKLINPQRPVPAIMSLKHRISLIRRLGVDICCVIRFNKNFAAINPRDFAGKILFERFRAGRIFIGNNFVFGKDNEGDALLLKRLGEEYGFKVTIVPLVKVSGLPVSSSLIRRLIIKGNLEKAAHMLGRPVAVCGRVVRGAGRGRLLGYPTANIDPNHEAIPPSGIYASWVKVGEKSHPAALFIGPRRTFGEKEPVIEAHILDFSNMIYGRNIEVTFVRRLRGIRKFSSKAKLIEQIKKDDSAARKILNVRKPEGMRKQHHS